MAFEYQDFNSVTKSTIIENPTWDLINFHLNEINMTQKSYFILSQGDNYVQCAGAKAKLTIVYKSIKHYRFSLKAIDNTPASINFSYGIIQIMKSEQLRLIHALDIFETFYKTGLPSNDYVLNELNIVYS
jgi:hypothetical protein